MNSEHSLNRTIREVWEQRYVVPLYQRNFAWQEKQIGQLIQDIYDHSPLNENNKTGRYYLGSLILLQRRDGTWEVIDGQQRLTALHIICRYLEIFSTPRLSYDSRPEVESFFDYLFNTDVKTILDSPIFNYNSNVINLVEALHIVNEYKIRISDTETVTLDDLKHNSRDKIEKLKNYLLDKVVLVCTPLPVDTDVAAYFEIMNNRGEQLESHEILKAVMMRDITNYSDRKLFAMIWDACSQMDRPIQRSLIQLRRVGVFGDNYDTIALEKLESLHFSENSENYSNAYDIDEILKPEFCYNKVKKENNEENDVKYRSIIDFPNFLMLALRLYEANAKQRSDQPNTLTTPLNDDYLPTSTPPFINDSMDFIRNLLHMRVLFDRYVVKMDGEDENDDLKWRLLRPYKYLSKDNCELRFAYSNDDDTEDNEALQNRVIKQQSMLQVTFSNHKYKQWLYDYLKWLMSIKGNIDTNDIVKKLDIWMKEYYDAVLTKWEGKDLLCAGTGTPHFLLNFIDYLYWLESKKTNIDERLTKGLAFDFNFKYYSSVEHHLPRSYKNIDSVDTDMIGNLCLISRRKNSSLKDKGPEEKAKLENGLQPKRHIMYKTTLDNHHWGRCEIEQHQNEIKMLLSEIPDLLCLNHFQQSYKIDDRL